MGKGENAGNQHYLLPLCFYPNLVTKTEIIIWQYLSSANVSDLDKSRILSFGIELTLSLLSTTQEAFVYSVDEDQTVEKTQSDL